MQIGVLGPLMVSSPDGPVDIEPRRARALLCWLAMNANRPVSTASAVAVLWQGRAPASAPAHVARLARSLAVKLGRDTITTGPMPALHIDADRLDESRFRELADRAERARAAGDTTAALAAVRAAMSLWRGHPYPELDRALPAIGPIDRLAERYLDCLELGFRLRLAGPVDFRLVADLREAAVLHPERDRLRCQLALAQYRCGRQVDALATLRSVPSDSAGDPQARSLLGAILRHAPELQRGEMPSP